MDRPSSRLSIKTTKLSQNDVVKHVLELEKGFIKSVNKVDQASFQPRNTLAGFQKSHDIHPQDTNKRDNVSESHEYSDFDDLDLVKIEDESISDSDAHSDKRKKSNKNKQNEIEIYEKDKTKNHYSKIAIQEIEANESKKIEAIKKFENEYRIEIEAAIKKIDLEKMSEKDTTISKRSITVSKKDEKDKDIDSRPSISKKDDNDKDIDRPLIPKKDDKKDINRPSIAKKDDKRDIDKHSLSKKNDKISRTDDSDIDKLSVKSGKSMSIGKKIDLSQDTSGLASKGMHEGWLDTSSLIAKVEIKPLPRVYCTMIMIYKKH